MDPYAPLVKGRNKFAERDEFERFQEKVRATVIHHPPFA